MSQEICQMMHKGALLHKRIMSKILERYDLTYAQFQVLKIIHEQPGITAKEILIYLDSDKATLSGVLSRLERNAMIERSKDAEDRRLVHTALTDKSRAVCEEVLAIEETCQQDLMKGLRTREVKHFTEGFKQVLQNQEQKLREHEVPENQEEE